MPYTKNENVTSETEGSRHALIEPEIFEVIDPVALVTALKIPVETITSHIPSQMGVGDMEWGE